MTEKWFFCALFCQISSDEDPKFPPMEILIPPKGEGAVAPLALPWCHPCVEHHPFMYLAVFVFTLLFYAIIIIIIDGVLIIIIAILECFFRRGENNKCSLHAKYFDEPLKFKDEQLLGW